MNKTTKRVLALGLPLVVVAGSGVAFAFWTSEGSGTGTAQIGTTSRNVVITGSTAYTAPQYNSDGSESKAAVGALYPGSTAVPVTLKVSNPNTYSVSLAGTVLKLTHATCGDTDATGKLVEHSDWFTILPTATTTTPGVLANANNVINSTTVVPAHTAPDSPVTLVDAASPKLPIAIAMKDSTTANQDVCKGVVVNYVFTSDLPAA
jgi:hypothetical protein